jgi:hypothetical protein
VLKTGAQALSLWVRDVAEIVDGLQDALAERL